MDKRQQVTLQIKNNNINPGNMYNCMSPFYNLKNTTLLTYKFKINQ